MGERQHTLDLPGPPCGKCKMLFASLAQHARFRPRPSGLLDVFPILTLWVTAVSEMELMIVVVVVKGGEG